MSLRTRLLASYLAMVALTISIITIALVIFLANQQEPPYNTYRELLAIASNLESGTVNSVLAENNRRFPQRMVMTRLDSFADSYDIRILTLALQPSNKYAVEFDTSSVFPQSGELPQHYIDSSIKPAQLRNQTLSRVTRVTANFGWFNDQNTEWLYVLITQDGNTNKALLLADERPNRSLRASLAQFGPAIGTPVVQAAIIGFAAAFILAALMTQTIARPLRNLSKAAQEIAEGNYDHKVSEEGPMEIRAVAEAFNQMAEEVEKTHQSQRDFLANVSHDLKTPLTSIQGYSQAIMDGAAKDPSRAAAIISDEAGRLTRMVTELTDLARLQAGAVQMNMSAIDAGQIVQSITQRLAVVAQKKGITLQADIETAPPIAGDGDRLAQVFTNLISNAINYTPEGGTIRVTVHPSRGGVEISVRDTGIGIPPRELGRIFERFYQVDKTRGPRRGTGLGLAITHEIIQAHGGEVTVSSPGEGMGSTFTVWLPLGRLADAALNGNYHRG